MRCATSPAWRRALREIARPFGELRDYFRRRRLDRWHAHSHPCARGRQFGDPLRLLHAAISGIRRRCVPGLRHARGRAVIAMDCDFEHPPEVAAQLVQEWQRGAKVVVTRRLDQNGHTSAAKKTDLAAVLSRARRARRHAYRARQRRFHAARSRRRRRDQCALEDQDVFLRGLVRWLGFPLATVSYVPGRAAGRRLRASRCAAWSISP